MKSPQELVHWLEQGSGARWLRRAVVVFGALLLTTIYSWRQFHGVPTEFEMQQVVLARQIAQGQGFTTLVNYPQTYAVLKARGVPFDEHRPYPELHSAPFYPLVLAGVFAVLPSRIWQAAPAMPGAGTLDGWLPDYVVLGVNLVLFWIAVALAVRLAARLFDGRAAAVAGLAIVVSVTLWQQTVTLTGMPLLMVLVLSLFLVLLQIEERLTAGTVTAAADSWRFGVLGVLAGLILLTEYSAGLIIAPVGGYLAWRLPARVRWRLLPVLLAAWVLILAPWLARNVVVLGNPLGLAWQNLALKAGDPTAEPSAQRNLMSVESPAFSLNKFGNKGLTGMERNLKERLWSGGGMLLTAFFVAGLAYRFRHAPVNRMRWCFALCALALLGGDPFLASGESARLPAYYLAPLIIVFGTGFLFVLIESQPALAQHWRWVAAGLLVLQGLPLLRDALEPKKIHFHFPPYYPGLFMELDREMHRRFLPGTGAASDVPAGSAWYSGARVWSKPERLRDFSQIIVEQNIGALLLTPVTLDRPFFTELATRSEERIRLTDAGGWGDVYAALVDRRLAMPAGFPLNLRPQKLTENMVLLVNPQTLTR